MRLSLEGRVALVTGGARDRSVGAILYDGIYDRAGNKLIPRAAADGALPAARAREVHEWLDRSLARTEELERVDRVAVAKGTTDLWQLTELANEQLGPYPEFTTELGAGVRAAVAL